MISFTVPSIPVAQPRQRHRIVGTARGAFTQNYTPTKHPVNSFKVAVQMAAREVYQGKPLEGAIDLQLVFVFPRPKKFIWKTREMPRLWKASKPDCDNLAKSVKDALSKLVWNDDGQIAYMAVRKWIASGDEQPHVEICIQPIEYRTEHCTGSFK